MPPPRPPSGPAWPLTTGVSETYWAWPGLEMVVKDEGREVPLTALAAACSARKRATGLQPAVGDESAGHRAVALDCPSCLYVCLL